jgi:hypothetical protein
MEVINYQITEGGNYGWSCFGENVYTLDSWNGDHNGYSISAIFDTKNHTVYELTAHDYKTKRSYRWIDPNFIKAYNKEAEQRDVNTKEAYDDVDFVDIEVVSDMLEKTRAIVNGEVYDTRVQIELDLPDELMLQLYKLAHTNDITLNQMIEKILLEVIERHKDET